MASKKETVVTVRLTAEEKELLRSLSVSAGVTMSEMLRKVLRK